MKHDDDYYFEAFLYSFPVMMSVIVADNGNKSLRKTCQWNTYNEHGTLHDG